MSEKAAVNRLRIPRISEYINIYIEIYLGFEVSFHDAMTYIYI